jgi:DNA-binding transcriptional ArsR family regulator
MSEQDDFNTLLGFFKALGNENRLKIVAILAEEACTVRDLAQ